MYVGRKVWICAIHRALRKPWICTLCWQSMDFVYMNSQFFYFLFFLFLFFILFYSFNPCTCMACINQLELHLKPVVYPRTGPASESGSL